MKALISALVSDDANPNIKTTWIPLPVPTDAESVELLAERFGLNSGSYGNSDEEILAYRSPLGFTIDADEFISDVEALAKRLQMLTSEQLESLHNLCLAFNLTFNDVQTLIKNITPKGDNENE